MRKLVDNKTAQVLTTEKANSLKGKKIKMLLLRVDGSYTFIYTYSEVFVCSGDDRNVFYVEAKA